MQVKGSAANLAALLFLFVCSVVPFLAAACFGIVNCDDYDYLKFAADSARSVFGLEQAIFMPVTWLTYRLDLFASSCLGVEAAHLMHVQSIFWHGLNAVLFCLVLTRLFPSAGRVGIVFAVLAWSCHPLRVESVVWVSSRKDVVSLCFLLGAWLAWLSCRRSRSAAAYVLSLALMTIGCAAKPSAMVFPVMAALADLCLLGERCLLTLRERPLAALAYGPHLFVALVTAALASYAQGYGGAMDVQASVPLWWRLCNAVSSVGVYLVNSVLPLGLAPQCLIRWPGMPRAFLLNSAVCLAALGFAGLLLRRWRQSESRPIFCGLAVFLLTLVPFLGIVGFGLHAYADRFTYIPSLGLSIMLVWLFAKAGRAALPCGLALVVVLGVLTSRQTRPWADDGALWARTLEVDGPSNCEALINLGFYHYEFTHDLDRAADCLRRAYALNPKRCGRGLHVLLLALCEKGDREGAREAYMDLTAWNTREVEAAQRRGERIGSTLGFRIGRAVYLKDNPEMAKLVRDELAWLRANIPDNIHVKYLQHLFGELRAEDVITDDPCEYMQYRFLRLPK